MKDTPAPAWRSSPGGVGVLPDPEAIIFDLDGTLVDTVGRRVTAWRQAFTEAGIASDDTHLASLMGSDGRWLAGQVALRAGRELDAEAAEALDHRSGELFSELNRVPSAHEGVTDLLRALDAAGRRWAVATSSRPAQVRASIDALGLGHEPIVTDGSHVAHAKPAPDLLLAAADQLGVPSERCWYVGDATWDMLAARAAGMTAIGVASGAVSQEALKDAGAQLTCARIGELHEEMRRWGMLPASGGIERVR